MVLLLLISLPISLLAGFLLGLHYARTVKKALSGEIDE